MMTRTQKPGRQFEEAVCAFARTLDPTAEVIFDHNVLDRDTQEHRQCDVWINAKFGGHWPLSILVSCKDHGRKLHVGDIGSFCDEIRSTGASTGVIYSRVGFTKPALVKAKANGIACCRIYQNEPADLPSSISFYQFVCKPTVQLNLKSKLNESKYKIWNDLFEIPVQVGDNIETLLDKIVNSLASGEEMSLSEWQKYRTGNEFFFPQDWCARVSLRDYETNEYMEIETIGRWKRYRAKLEATLLQGSYCLSDGSFKGEMIGPSVDTQGEHPGKAWEEITEPDFDLPLNRILFFLHKANYRATLMENFAPNSLH